MSDIGIDDPRSLARDREELGPMNDPESVPKDFIHVQAPAVTYELRDASGSGFTQGKRVSSHGKHAPSAQLCPQGLAALALARSGVPVFPCGPDKRPLTKEGFKAATLDLDQVSVWWMKTPNAMIGVPTGEPSGLFVVDLDVDKKTGAQIGDASLRRIAPEVFVGPSCTTQSGGRHLYFHHQPGLGSTVGRIGLGVDTRGEGGYVIVPPSRGERGAYVLSGPVDWKNLPEVPEVLLNRLRSKPRQAQLDRAPNIEEVSEILARIDPDCCYQDWVNVLMGLHALFGGSGQGLDLAEAWSSQGAKFVPGDVARRWQGFAPGGGVGWASVCAMARASGANLSAVARKYRAPSVASAPRALAVQAPEAKVNLKATPFVPVDPRTIPPRQWLYGQHLIRKQVSVTVAPGGIGKSSLTMVEALAMATGRPLLGETVPKPLNVWVYNLEDPMEEMERRMNGAMIHHGISAEELGNRLFLNSGRDQPLCMAVEVAGNVTIQTPCFEALEAEIKARKIDVLVIDPFISSHRVSENANGAIDLVAKEWARLADRCNCAIELVHHTRKTNGGEATSEDARGSSALLAAARSGRVLNRMTDTMKESAGLKGDPATVFGIDRDKANLAPNGKRKWIRMASVELGQGDTVGVAEAWEWPDTFEGLTSAHLLRVQQAIDGKQPRFSDQAADWAGVIVAKVLGLDPSADKKRIKRMIQAWLDSGALVKVMVDDRKSMQRPCIGVGAWANEPLPHHPDK